MTLIQPILIALLFSAAVLCLWSLRFRLLVRLIAVTLAGLGIVCVVHPELTNSIAHRLGVGRGADLMFYLFSLGSTYAFLIMYVKQRDIRRDLTKLTRSVALAHAVQPRTIAGSVPEFAIREQKGTEK